MHSTPTKSTCSSMDKIHLFVDVMKRPVESDGQNWCPYRIAGYLTSFLTHPLSCTYQHLTFFAILPFTYVFSLSLHPMLECILRAEILFCNSI